MLEIEILRILLVAIPITIIAMLYMLYEHNSRNLTAAFLAYIWQFQSQLIMYIIMTKLGLIEFNVTHGTFYGIPVDILVGQSLLFGFLMGLLTIKISIFVISIISFTASVLLAVNMSPLIVLKTTWYIYGFIILVSCITPSLLLAKYTIKDQHVKTRTVLQSLCWISLLTWIFPSIIFNYTYGSWQTLLQRPLAINGLLLLPLLIPIFIIGSALYEFAEKGAGTAFPYDPPKRLVTTGIYRYISNPMQAGVCIFMAYWGFIIGNFYISSSALVAVLLFIVFKDVCNGSCQIGKTDPNWIIYQKQVPRWIPRLKPYKMSAHK